MERPILFSGPMVRAILEGRKTQTRRVIKPSPSQRWLKPEWIQASPAAELATVTGDLGAQLHTHDGGPLTWVKCPYGNVGDRLWVKETHLFTVDDASFMGSSYGSVKEAFSDNSPEECERQGWIYYRAEDPHPDFDSDPVVWRPSIFMPRWASRLSLQITSVRAERFNEVAAQDAIAEGIKGITKDGHLLKYGIADREGEPGEELGGWLWTRWRSSPIEAYLDLWNSINGETHPWQSNPWVWVVEFKVAS